MSSLRGPDVHSESALGWIVALIVILAIIIAGFAWVSKNPADPLADTKPAKELKAYREAEAICGEHNVYTHEYTNGSVDFSCSNYSRAPKK